MKNILTITLLLLSTLEVKSEIHNTEPLAKEKPTIFDRHIKQYGADFFSFEDENWTYKEYKNDITIIYYQNKTAVKLATNRTFTSSEDMPILCEEMHVFLASHGFNIELKHCPLIIQSSLQSGKFECDSPDKALKFIWNVKNLRAVELGYSEQILFSYLLWNNEIYSDDLLMNELSEFESTAIKSKEQKIEKVDF